LLTAGCVVAAIEGRAEALDGGLSRIELAVQEARSGVQSIVEELAKERTEDE